MPKLTPQANGTISPANARHLASRDCLGLAAFGAMRAGRANNKDIQAVEPAASLSAE